MFQKTLLVSIVALLAGVGCGKNKVNVTVDVASFMSAEELSGNYVVPPLENFEVNLPAIEVNLNGRFDDVSDVESMEVDVEIEYNNDTGAGDAVFRLFFGDDPATLYSTPEVLLTQATLSPRTSTQSTLTIQADERVRNLMLGDRLFVGLQIDWTPQGSQVLAGQYQITVIKAQVVSSVDLF